MKKCFKCLIDKTLFEFNKDKQKKDGLCSYCISCSREKKNNAHRELTVEKKDDLGKQRKIYTEKHKLEKSIYDKKYNEANSEKIKERSANFYIKNKEKFKEKSRKYSLDNKERTVEYQNRWYLENKEHCIELAKQWRIENRQKYLENRKKNKKQRLLTDPNFKLRENISSSIRKTLKSNGLIKNTSTWSKLSYTPKDLKEHLEKQFEPWMNWENHGSLSKTKKTWQIDHIVPQSNLLYDSMDHPNFIECWKLENLRPLDALENVLKSNKSLEWLESL